MNITFKSLSMLATIFFCSVAMADLPTEERDDVSVAGDFGDVPIELSDVSAQGDLAELPTDIADISAQGGMTELPTAIADVSAQGGLANIPTELADVSAQSGMGSELDNAMETLSEFPNLHESMDDSDAHVLDGLMLTGSANLLKLKEVQQ